MYIGKCVFTQQVHDSLWGSRYVLSLSLIRIFDDFGLSKENLLYLLQTTSIVSAIIHDKLASKAGIRELPLTGCVRDELLILQGSTPYKKGYLERWTSTSTKILACRLSKLRLDLGLKTPSVSRLQRRDRDIQTQKKRAAREAETFYLQHKALGTCEKCVSPSMALRLCGK